MTGESINISFDSRLPLFPSREDALHARPYSDQRCRALRCTKSIDICSYLEPQLYVSNRNHCGAVMCDAWSFVMHLSYTSQTGMKVAADLRWCTESIHTWMSHIFAINWRRACLSNFRLLWAVVLLIQCGTVLEPIPRTRELFGLCDRMCLENSRQFRPWLVIRNKQDTFTPQLDGIVFSELRVCFLIWQYGQIKE